MSQTQQSNAAQDSVVLPKPNPLPRAVGYSLLRCADGPTLEVCILVPYVNPIKSASFDPVSRRIEADVDGARIALTDLPPDIVALISKHPDKVLLVLVDTLSRARHSVRVSDILAPKI